MKLIADSGSTKTDWRLIDKGKEISSFSTIGFNPYHIGKEAIEKELKSVLLPKVDPSKINTIHFYGAGCSTLEMCAIVEGAIQKCFPKSKLEIEHDILGAARSVWAHEEGIAVILGTGSNSCYYNGKEITEGIPSLGYLLGDEGGGVDMGKRLLKAVLSKQAPHNIIHRFNQKYEMNREEILKRIYQEPLPNRFIASFAPFLFHNMDEKFIRKMIVESFTDFFDNNVCRYESYKYVKVRCIGSIAYNFSNILEEVAKSKGVVVDKIVSKPIDGLVEYHSG